MEELNGRAEMEMREASRKMVADMKVKREAEEAKEAEEADKVLVSLDGNPHDTLRFGIATYRGEGDPVLAIDMALAKYNAASIRNDEGPITEFIDTSMDNPWVRVFTVGDLTQVHANYHES